jgi:hypothetical protein
MMRRLLPATDRAGFFLSVGYPTDIHLSGPSSNGELSIVGQIDLHCIYVLRIVLSSILLWLPLR